MKVSFDIDCTPEEARRMLGLPDVTPVNEALVAELTKRAAEMAQKMLDSKLVRGCHIYTLNLEKSAVGIVKKLGLYSEDTAVRQLPWRPSTMSPRRTAEETVRPIFWANRPRSYLARCFLRFVLQCCYGLLQISQFVLQCRPFWSWDAQGTSKLSCSLSWHLGNFVAEPFCRCCYVLLQWQRVSGQSFWQAGLLALLHDSIAPLRSGCFRRAIAAFPLAKHGSEVILEVAR